MAMNNTFTDKVEQSEYPKVVRNHLPWVKEKVKAKKYNKKDKHQIKYLVSINFTFVRINLKNFRLVKELKKDK